MVGSRRLACLLAVLIALTSAQALGWGTCEIKITVPEDAKLECTQDASEPYEIEAEIISTETLGESIKCVWTDRYEGLVELESVDNVCRAQLTADKAEAHFISVAYSESGTTKKCSSTKKLDVKPICCVPL